jgi:hypothetical protein
MTHFGLPWNDAVVARCYSAIDVAVRDCVGRLQEYFLVEGIRLLVFGVNTDKGLEGVGHSLNLLTPNIFPMMLRRITSVTFAINVFGVSSVSFNYQLRLTFLQYFELHTFVKR